MELEINSLPGGQVPQVVKNFPGFYGTQSNSLSGCQEFSHLLWNSEVQYHVQNSKPLEHALSQNTALRFFISQILKIHIRITLICAFVFHVFLPISPQSFRYRLYPSIQLRYSPNRALTSSIEVR
jgi:hypothetical protein